MLIMKKTKSRLQSSLFLWSLIISVSGLTDLKAQDQITLNNSSGNPIGLLVDGKLNGSVCALPLLGLTRTQQNGPPDPQLTQPQPEADDPNMRMRA